jgi:hypothetical protein
MDFPPTPSRDIRSRRDCSFGPTPASRCIVRNFPTSKRCRRAGVLLVTTWNGIVYFGFGVHGMTHELSDFGGSMLHIDRTSIHTAMREFSEETLDIFNPLTMEDIKNSPVIYDDYNLIMFLVTSVDPDEVGTKFLARYEKIVNDERSNRCYRELPELCEITWLTWKELQEVIRVKKSPNLLYEKVRSFLEKAGDLSEIL